MMNASIAGVDTTSWEWRNRASRSIMRASLDSVDRMQASTKRASRTLSSCCAAATDAADGATADAELRCRPVCERGATVKSYKRANKLGRRGTDRRVEDALAEAGRAGELLRDAHRAALEQVREQLPQRLAAPQARRLAVGEVGDDHRRVVLLGLGPLAAAPRLLAGRLPLLRRGLVGRHVLRRLDEHGDAVVRALRDLVEGLLVRRGVAGALGGRGGLGGLGGLGRRIRVARGLGRRGRRLLRGAVEEGRGGRRPEGRREDPRGVGGGFDGRRHAD
mmetsp:Transcript_32206/g.109438  ORF Transcript_32206/g.109438 Transcript_32206/m.109438 type:complete len:277 (+) Transcript_32206:131-961(+)